MFERLLEPFLNLGLTGAIIAVLVYDVFILQTKLISIIENNTKVMSELKSAVDEFIKEKHHHG